jgi:Tfp pilus assembly protein PilZ
MTELSIGPERRLSLRNPIDVPVWLERQPGRRQAPSLIKAQTRDVSHKGLFVWAPPVFKVGEHLRLEMNVAPDPNRNLELHLQGEAEVVRIEPPQAPGGRSGFGLRILSFQPATPLIFPHDPTPGNA